MYCCDVVVNCQCCCRIFCLCQYQFDGDDVGNDGFDGWNEVQDKGYYCCGIGQFQFGKVKDCLDQCCCYCVDVCFDYQIVVYVVYDGMDQFQYFGGVGVVFGQLFDFDWELQFFVEYEVDKSQCQYCFGNQVGGLVGC